MAQYHRGPSAWPWKGRPPAFTHHQSTANRCSCRRQQRRGLSLVHGIFQVVTTLYFTSPSPGSILTLVDSEEISQLIEMFCPTGT
jgi:hypothetical protein